MKKESLSFFILFVEIAAIILLHSAKSHHTDGYKAANARKSTVASYQLKALTLTKIK